MTGREWENENMKRYGRIWGVTWERHHWGVECSAIVGAYRESRKYVGNGSDPVRVGDCVAAFRRDVFGVGR